MTSTAIIVPFHGTELFVVEHNGQPFAPMRPIVEGMGMDWASQFVKLKQRFASTVVEITMVANDGKERLMTCLPVRKLAAWLYSISPNKIPNLETRAKVIMYQNECDDVLWDYWTKGQAINKRVVVSTEQKNALQQLVATRCGNSQKLRAEMWTRHNNHFNVHSYHELLAIRFEDSKQYLQTMELRTKPEATAPTAPPQDAFNLMFNGVRTKMTEYVCQLQNELISRGGQVPKFPVFDKDAIAAETIQSIVRNRRMFMTFDHEGQPQVKFVPGDCYVIRESELPKMIEDGNGVSKSLLPDIMQSVMKRLGLAAK